MRQRRRSDPGVIDEYINLLLDGRGSPFSKKEILVYFVPLLYRCVQELVGRGFILLLPATGFKINTTSCPSGVLNRVGRLAVRPPAHRRADDEMHFRSIERPRISPE